MTEAAQSPAPTSVLLPQFSKVPPAPRSTPIKPPTGQIPLTLSPSPKFTLPKLRLEIRDLGHAGAQAFLTSVIASDALKDAVYTTLALLYESPESRTTTIPPTRSVTLVVRSMGGVAYTTSTELDSDHKEIHLSMDHIHKVALDRKTDEIRGVLTHEMVHCYQYNGFGSCPGGLIEGIADWVRLNANLCPRHWKREMGGKWDAGYQHTGYFLEYLENRFGKSTIRGMNEKLRTERYEEKRFWTELIGRPVEQLWDDYQELLDKDQNAEQNKCVVEKRDGTAVAGTKNNNGN